MTYVSEYLKHHPVVTPIKGTALSPIVTVATEHRLHITAEPSDTR